MCVATDRLCSSPLVQSFPVRRTLETFHHARSRVAVPEAFKEEFATEDCETIDCRSRGQAVRHMSLQKLRLLHQREIWARALSEREKK